MDTKLTLKLNQEIKPDIAQYTIFFPFKGTPLFDICKKEGYLKGDYPDLFNYYNRSILTLPNFKPGEIQKWHKKAERLSNPPKKKTAKRK